MKHEKADGMVVTLRRVRAGCYLVGQQTLQHLPRWSHPCALCASADEKLPVCCVTLFTLIGGWLTL